MGKYLATLDGRRLPEDPAPARPVSRGDAGGRFWFPAGSPDADRGGGLPLGDGGPRARSSHRAKAKSAISGFATWLVEEKGLLRHPRQNGLAKALREIGKIERTLFTLRWLQDPDLRRRVTAGLNKGEARSTLTRAVFLNCLGESRNHSQEDQMNRAGGLALITAAVVLWNTAHPPAAVAELRRRGEEIPDEQFGHLSPLGREHVTPTDTHRWDLTPTFTLETLLNGHPL